MSQPIQDNQYKEAPQQAPYLLGSEPFTKEELQDDMKKYRISLVKRILDFDMCLVLRVREVQYLLVERNKEYSWKVPLLKDQPIQVLTNIYTWLSNTEEILKEDPRLLD